MKRKGFDAEEYVERVLHGPCFVCGIVAREPGYEVNRVLYEDDTHIAFLNAYPTLLGYSLVCPKRHVEDIVDMSTEDYLATQGIIHKVSRALKSAVPTERMYVMSLGSMQGNSHIHWHVAPLPPGVEYSRQQYHALMAENGVIDMSPSEADRLVARIRDALDA